MPAALLTLPCTMKELAELWLRSAASSVLIVPSLENVLLSADCVTEVLWKSARAVDLVAGGAAGKEFAARVGGTTLPP